MAAVPSGWKGVLGMPQENSRDRDACVRIHKSPSRTWRWDVGQQVNDTHRRSAKRKSTIKKLNRFSLPPRGLLAVSGTIVQALSMLTFVASPEAVALTLP